MKSRRRRCAEGNKQQQSRREWKINGGRGKKIEAWCEPGEEPGGIERNVRVKGSCNYFLYD